jgi:hypothetical protein
MELEGCYFHPDEAPARPGDYRVCGECGHVFCTEAELVMLYIAEAPEGVPLPPMDGSSIYFCPVCIHDF